MHNWIRGAAFVIGPFVILGGFLAASTGTDVTGGITAIVFGTVIIVAALLQRPRYRSNVAEMGHQEAGPGGGESGYLEPRFLPTTEVFRDPTSGRLMRVFVDPRTGERRYRAEG